MPDSLAFLFHAFDSSAPVAARRLVRLEECLRLLDRLLRGETVSSLGRYYPITEAVVRPQPVQLPRPPLLVAALGAMTITLAVRYADIWKYLGRIPCG